MSVTNVNINKNKMCVIYLAQDSGFALLLLLLFLCFRCCYCFSGKVLGIILQMGRGHIIFYLFLSTYRKHSSRCSIHYSDKSLGMKFKATHDLKVAFI